MKFSEVGFEGVYLVTPDKHIDNRGSFCRTFDKHEMYNLHINFNILQTSLSFNTEKGTVRGMHYQCKPCEEKKIIQCVSGSIYDVIIDLRSSSKTFNKWYAFNLNDKNNCILYIPFGIAHGFQTLEDDTTVLYYMNQEYHPKCAKIINYKNYDIKWKLHVTNISEKDRCENI